MDSGARRSALKDELSQAAEKLELSAVLEMVARSASSERTAGAILSENILGNIEEIEKRQNETLELMKIRQNGEDLPVAGWRDSTQELSMISVEGMTVSGEDLAAIAAAEKKAAEVNRFIERSKEEMPLLSEYLAGFSIREDIVRRIEKTIGPDFEVLDRASPRTRTSQKDGRQSPLEASEGVCRLRFLSYERQGRGVCYRARGEVRRLPAP